MTIKTTGWPPEKRARMAKRTREQKPWERSTGPKTAKGKDAVRYNALKHAAHSAEFLKLKSLLKMLEERP